MLPGPGGFAGKRVFLVESKRFFFFFVGFGGDFFGLLGSKWIGFIGVFGLFGDFKLICKGLTAAHRLLFSFSAEDGRLQRSKALKAWRLEKKKRPLSKAPFWLKQKARNKKGSNIPIETNKRPLV